MYCRFMCALHPSLRNDWARTWTKVMKSGGYLIALEYPIRPDDKTGPPWPVSPQIYADLLIPLGQIPVTPFPFFAKDLFKDWRQAFMSHCWSIVSWGLVGLLVDSRKECSKKSSTCKGTSRQNILRYVSNCLRRTALDISHLKYKGLSAGFKNVYYKEIDQASLSHPRMTGAEVLACFQKL